jgi:hypothetical protein
VVLANYIDLRLRGDLGLAKPEIAMFVQVDEVQTGDSVGSLSLWEKGWGEGSCLPTIPVGGSVDNVFAFVCTPRQSSLTALRLKNNQPKSRIFRAFSLG